MTCKVQQPARIDTDKIEYIVQTRIWNSEYIHAERFRFFFWLVDFSYPFELFYLLRDRGAVQGRKDLNWYIKRGSKKRIAVLLFPTSASIQEQENKQKTWTKQ